MLVLDKPTRSYLGVPSSLSMLLVSATDDNVLFSTSSVLVSSLLSHGLTGLALHQLCDNAIDPGDTSVIDHP